MKKLFLTFLTFGLFSFAAVAVEPITSGPACPFAGQGGCPSTYLNGTAGCEDCKLCVGNGHTLTDYNSDPNTYSLKCSNVPPSSPPNSYDNKGNALRTALRSR